MKNLGKINTSDKGITLIALIITIIVLLILAGISIATLTGENGVLTKANTARIETERVAIIERSRTDVLAIQSDHEGKITKEQFDKVLEDYDKEKKSDRANEKGERVIETDKNYVIKVTEIYDGPFAEGKSVFYVESTEIAYEENMIWTREIVNLFSQNWIEDGYVGKCGDRCLLIGADDEGISFFCRSYDTFYLELNGSRVHLGDEIVKGASYTFNW